MGTIDLRGRPAWRRAGQLGMSSIELVICICVMAVVAAIFIPGYITYTQQSRVLALVLPRLQQLESNISIHYMTTGNKFPTDHDLPELMQGIKHENLEVKLMGGAVVLTIMAPDSAANVHILDGTTLVASPVIGPTGISSWHLSGELAERLGLSR